MTTITWTDSLEIGMALADAHPDKDPMQINFMDLRQLVLALPDFTGDPETCNERILEAIQMAWLDERD